jgi:hypothetical protein
MQVTSAPRPRKSGFVGHAYDLFLVGKLEADDVAVPPPYGFVATASFGKILPVQYVRLHSETLGIVTCTTSHQQTTLLLVGAAEVQSINAIHSIVGLSSRKREH